MYESKIKGMLLGAITGDAIGTPFDGLSKAHIHSTIKTIDNYTDTSPALKGKMDTWKKPGLYSSASQLMILLSIFAISAGYPDTHKFMRFIDTSPEVVENEYGIFRHPGSMIKHYIQTAKNNFPENRHYSSASAMTAVILIPFAVPDLIPDDMHMKHLVSFSLVFNREIHSVAGALIFNIILRRIINKGNSENIISLAADAVSSLHQEVEIFNPDIFELGMNPDYLRASIEDYLNILSEIKNVKEIDTAEKIIYTYVNTKIKTPITRATANHPMAIIPYSIYFADFYLNRPSDTLFRAAESGGSTSVLCAITGALTGAALGHDWIHGNLLDELVNKKRITGIVDSILKRKIPDDVIQDFLQCEASLTAKEIQEKNAKLKHVKIKNKKQKSRQEFENELSSHVVESWTKYDKAKWRKKADKNLLYNDDTTK